MNWNINSAHHVRKQNMFQYSDLGGFSVTCVRKTKLLFECGFWRLFCIRFRSGVIKNNSKDLITRFKQLLQLTATCSTNTNNLNTIMMLKNISLSLSKLDYHPISRFNSLFSSILLKRVLIPSQLLCLSNKF